MKLIDKDALVAEIEKRVGFNKALNAYSRADECNAILSFLDTIEVKEVDYDKALTEYLNNFENASIGHRLSIRRTAKHFFELGLRASNPLIWEDLKTLDDISDDVYAECDVEMFDEKEYYQEVLKRFKAQKGE